MVKVQVCTHIDLTDSSVVLVLRFRRVAVRIELILRLAAADYFRHRLLPRTIPILSQNGHHWPIPYRSSFILHIVVVQSSKLLVDLFVLNGFNRALPLLLLANLGNIHPTDEG